MAVSTKLDIAIIGGSLTGLTLALSLHSQGISCTIYEARDVTYNHGGAIVLAPNALRILDRLGAYSRLSTRGFHFRSINFMTEDNLKEGEWCFEDKQGNNYKGLRIYRTEILDELRKMINERGIPIHYSCKYRRTVSESANGGVAFELEDGSIRHAGLLVGADGLHSKVRSHITDAQPQYIGSTAIMCACDTNNLRFPSKDYELPVAISGEEGAFIVAPQKPDGSECMIGTTWVCPEESREGWKRMADDKQGLVKRLQADYDSWCDLPRSALEHIEQDSLVLWPLYMLPKLESWISKARRVIMMGDAAHMTLDDVLKFWQQYRQERIAKVTKLTTKMTNKRLPASERAKLPRDLIWDDKADAKVGWLFDPKLKRTSELGSKSTRRPDDVPKPSRPD
ncbi:MAG: hypothetical protein M1828_003834 [Chrysothrix sp. TS-e1954]|nr:MAG: hypothetical protein M1828_003834 [Chrysothrix sp. TS-e1954]